jgi:hypothetical protein
LLAAARSSVMEHAGYHYVLERKVYICSCLAWQCLEHCQLAVLGYLRWCYVQEIARSRFALEHQI